MVIGIGLSYEKYLSMKILKRIGIGILFPEILKAKRNKQTLDLDIYHFMF